MYTDFYIRPEGDPNFIPGVMVLNDHTEALVAQLKMTLLTNHGEVLGDVNFGFSSFDYLFDTNDVDINSIEHKSMQQINDYVTLSKKTEVKTTAVVYEMDKYRNAIGLDIQVGDEGKFGILFD